MTMTLGQIDAARSIASWKAPDRPVATLKPINASRLSGNELRPTTFAEMIGQTHLKPLLERLVVAAKSSGRPLDHCLLSGSAGTGKTTTAMVIAHELGRDIFMLKAPVNLELLEELAAVAKDGDVVFVDEVHQQMLPDRRGVGQPADPEVFYHILEDRQLVTSTTVIPFPDVTFIGATTDLGRLPEPFIMRFPLQPRLEAYTDAEMATLATANADSLELLDRAFCGDDFCARQQGDAAHRQPLCEKCAVVCRYPHRRRTGCRDSDRTQRDGARRPRQFDVRDA